MRPGILGGLALGIGAGLYLQSRAEQPRPLELSDGDSHALLSRAAPLLRLPSSPDRAPEVLQDGEGLRCAMTGQIYPFREGILDLLGEAPSLTAAQRSLSTPFLAWGYDRFREGAMQRFGLPSFPEEVAAIGARLDPRPGEVVLDLACGHGNFTVEWAKRVGPDGLVLGLDLSLAMLARASDHLRAWGIRNALLIRGDAQRLPLAEASVGRINCSGGFHQLPDLGQALRELGRVSRPGTTLTASTFALAPEDRYAGLKRWLHKRFGLSFVELPWLEERLREQGFRYFRSDIPGGWFAYTSARRAEV
jgi:ubiquinone/menaquinone biosynthesis C-methylase UbiE